jgi:TM2 domain-containing membrane protein YozV
MKTKSPIFICLIFIAFSVNVESQCYSINKDKFDSHQYIYEYGDPYNPVISGIFSLIVPGMGQIFCGETGRGLAFMGGYAGCTVLFLTGAVQLTSHSFLSFGNSHYTGNSGVGVMLMGFGGMAAIEIWSIFDAVKVSKVNNMYIRSLRNTSLLKLEMSPYADQFSIKNQVSNPIGLTMRVKF